MIGEIIRSSFFSGLAASSGSVPGAGEGGRDLLGSDIELVGLSSDSTSELVKTFREIDQHER